MNLGAVLKRCAAVAWPSRVMWRGTARDSRVALTFDDGPHPQYTLPLLDVLAKAQAQATFFLQGAHAERWPDLVREIHRQGHQVANHAHSHRSARKLPTAVFVREVEQTQAVLEGIVGQALTRDFRPPFGDTTVRSFLQLAARGYRWVFWSHDSDDSVIRDPHQLAQRTDGLRLGGGDIALFHEDYAHTLAAMPQILVALSSRGLRAVRVDALDDATQAGMASPAVGAQGQRP
jgi:peptidoglycan-N-acetylglucosamine deacetylase